MDSQEELESTRNSRLRFLNVDVVHDELPYYRPLVEMTPVERLIAVMDMIASDIARVVATVNEVEQGRLISCLGL